MVYSSTLGLRVFGYYSGLLLALISTTAILQQPWFLPPPFIHLRYISMGIIRRSLVLSSSTWSIYPGRRRSYHHWGNRSVPRVSTSKIRGDIWGILHSSSSSMFCISCCFIAPALSSPPPSLLTIIIITTTTYHEYRISRKLPRNGF